MKAIYLTALALAAVFAVPALAETPNRTKMGWHEFLEASGCVLVDRGGYFNIALAADPTDPCPQSVRAAFWGGYTRLDVGPDGIEGTADDKRVSDN